MPRRTLLVNGAFATCCLALTACGSGPTPGDDPAWFARLADAHTRPVVESLPSGWRAGLAAATEVAAPRPGDRLLYFARLVGPNGVEEDFVSVTTLPSSTADDTVALDVAVFDRFGHLLGRAEHHIRRMHLTAGLHTAARELLHPRARLEPAELGPIVSGVNALQAILKIVEDDSTLSPLLWRVVEKPSLWSVITHLGVRATITLGIAEVSPLDRPGGSSEALRTPIAVTLNDAPALRCSVVSIEPRAPYSATGGVLSLVAERPDATHLRFELHLLGAVRAP